MSAALSSLIGVTADQSHPDVGGRVGASDPVPADLLAALAAVTDPRRRRGVRHALVVVIGLAVCAVLSGARSYVAIAEWSADLPTDVARRLGIRRDPPCETSIRRMLQAIDPDLLNRVVSEWLIARAAAGQAAAVGPVRPAWPVIAVDGKTLRGARDADARQTHLLAAFDVAAGVVLTQRTVEGKSNEITAFEPLLDGVDITGTLITADALHTQQRHAHYLHLRGAHFVFTVKGNQALPD